MPLAIKAFPPPYNVNMGDDDGCSPGFDEEEMYYPVFCLSEVPNNYFDEFDKQAGENDVCDVPWIEVTTSDGPSVLEDLRQNASSGDPSPTPFRNWSLPQVYQFYLRHLRPNPDGTGTRHFTSFTFFAIDRECVQSSPPQCIVCCDAPDFDESNDEVKLKAFRMPIAQAMPCMAALEMLSMTPSEVRDRTELCLKVHPQPMLVSSLDNPNFFQLATPAEGRANKRAGIRMAEGLGLDGTNRRTAEYLQSSDSQRQCTDQLNALAAATSRHRREA